MTDSPIGELKRCALCGDRSPLLRPDHLLARLDAELAAVRAAHSARDTAGLIHHAPRSVAGNVIMVPPVARHRGRPPDAATESPNRSAPAGRRDRAA